MEALKKLICEFSPVPADEINEDTDIRNELEMNSLELVNLAVAIEGEFDLEISDEDVMRIRTVGDLLELIENNR